KYISATVADEKTGEIRYVEGEVSEVRSASGQVYLVVDGMDVPVDKITKVSETPLGYRGMEIERYNSMIGLLSTVRTNAGQDDSPYIMDGIVAKLQKKQDGIYATLDEVILSVTDVQKDAFGSVEEYIENMKGREIIFRAKDAETGQTIVIPGILRDGVRDEEKECFHVILDNVEVPVEDIVSTRKVDLVSTEHQLLSEILKAIRDLEGKLPEIPGETNEPGGTEETEEPGGTEETGEPGGTEETGDAGTDENTEVPTETGGEG
ncbi:MAG: flagellar biosynthesis protein FlgD, partial [Clostridiaceae bacterium]|nr:flagellar biosynthesis protein FlgD [Clostridiaceae bacterium]